MPAGQGNCVPHFVPETEKRAGVRGGRSHLRCSPPPWWGGVLEGGHCGRGREQGCHSPRTRLGLGFALNPWDALWQGSPSLPQEVSLRSNLSLEGVGWLGVRGFNSQHSPVTLPGWTLPHSPSGQ